MATDLQTPPEQQSLTGIVSGIVHDFETLISQQLDMVRAEVRRDWEKARQAIWPIAVGSVLLTVGGIMISFMLVYLLHWATSPGIQDLARVPLWGCYGLVGAGFLIAGGTMLGAGIARFHSSNLLPEKSAEALKENVKWLTNNK
jgi:hypothetical protein